MTDEQFNALMAMLERIALALEPAPPSLPEVPRGRRIQVEKLVEEKVKELVTPGALKPSL